MNKIKIIILWSGFSGYSVSCWKELAKYNELELYIWPIKSFCAFNINLLEGLNYKLIDPDSTNSLLSDIQNIKPNHIIVSGWAFKFLNNIVLNKSLNYIIFTIAIDTQYDFTWRKLLAKFYLHKLLKRYNNILVASENSYVYSKYLGFKESNIYRGTYGFDYDLFSQVYNLRVAQRPHNNGFLFIGRYIHIKGIYCLIDAYNIYRNEVDNPWPLTFCGSGDLFDYLNKQDNINVMDFKQPCFLPDIMLKNSVLVLPSLNEPWGVVIPEAMASGMPVICTDNCGASIDLIHNYVTGIKVNKNDSYKLSRAMIWMHNYSDRIPFMSYNSHILSFSYSSKLWAEKIYQMISFNI